MTRTSAFGPALRMPLASKRTVVISRASSGIGTVPQFNVFFAHCHDENTLLLPLANRCTTRPIAGPRPSAVAVQNPGATSATITLVVEREPSVRSRTTSAGPGAHSRGTTYVRFAHPAPV